MMTPLVTKALIKFAQESEPSLSRASVRQLTILAAYNAEHPADGQTSHKPNIGRGIGMAFGLWGLVVLQSVCQHQVGPFCSATKVAEDSSFSIGRWLLGSSLAGP